MSEAVLTTAQAYQHCLEIAQSHYENFPVASLLLPRNIRQPVAAIYSFARHADDIADEGYTDTESLNVQQRLDALAAMGRRLDDLQSGQVPNDPVFVALADAIPRFQLPMSLFHDLLSAFSQDVTKKRYQDFSEVLDYCRRSADPIGRLLLYLVDEASERNLRDSDLICSALQLINFYQDLSQDFHEMGRIYVPVEEMQTYGVSEHHFRDATTNDAMTRLMYLQYQRAGEMINSGAALGKRLKGRFGFEIRMIVKGGQRVLCRLMRQRNDLFSRPRLHAVDLILMLGAGLYTP